MSEASKLLVVSHPSVLQVNQHIYLELVRRGWKLKLVVPDSWRHEYAQGVFRSKPLPGLEEHYCSLPIALNGRPQGHFYRVNTFAYLRLWKPDVAFLEQESSSLAALQWAVACLGSGIPFGVQFAENLRHPFRFPGTMLRAIVLPRASFVAARSPGAAALARECDARGVVRIIPHNAPVWQTPSRTRNRSFTVGFVGRLVPEKGLDTLVQAISLLPATTHLVVVGDGPLRKWLESSTLTPSRLRILGGVDHNEMREAYEGMDVLVLPSRTTKAWAEQFGRALIEALSCGVPVVGSESGEIPWVIKSTGGGETFPEGDAASLARILEKFRQDDNLRHALAETGRRQVKRLFSAEAVADLLEDSLRLSVNR